MTQMIRKYGPNMALMKQKTGDLPLMKSKSASHVESLTSRGESLQFLSVPFLKHKNNNKAE